MTTRPDQSFVSKMIFDEINNTVWVGTGGGMIGRINPSNKTLLNIIQTGLPIISAMSLVDGYQRSELWVCGWSSSVVVVDRGQNVVAATLTDDEATEGGHEKGKGLDPWTNVGWDGGGKVWAARRGGGMVMWRINSRKKLRSIQQHQLDTHSDQITGILMVNKTSLWVSSFDRKLSIWV